MEIYFLESGDCMNYKIKKGQITTEMLAVLAGVFVIFMLMLMVFNSQRTNIISTENSLETYRIASGIGSAINSVWLAGDGAKISITITGNNETLAWVNNRSVYVQKGNAFYSWQLFTNNTDITNNITFGELIVKNTNGVISIENG